MITNGCSVCMLYRTELRRVNTGKQSKMLRCYKYLENKHKFSNYANHVGKEYWNGLTDLKAQCVICTVRGRLFKPKV